MNNLWIVSIINDFDIYTTIGRDCFSNDPGDYFRLFSDKEEAQKALLGMQKANPYLDFALFSPELCARKSNVDSDVYFIEPVSMEAA